MKVQSLEFGLHILIIAGGWVLINIPYFALTIGVFTTADGSFLWPSLSGTLINCLIFYGNGFFLIPRYLRLQKKMAYLGLLSTGFLLCSFLEVCIDYLLAQSMGIAVENRGGIGEIVLLVLVVNLLTLLASFAYRFSKDWFYHERLRHQLIAEKLAAELAFLKSQVNPHFLFNTLNNLFAMAIQNEDTATADGIRRLASLMRYMLHESNSDQIELDKELEYIKHYLALQRIRLIHQESSNVEWNVEGTTEKVWVAPMLFIPFIENAFKYGISLSQPMPIQIQFWVNEKELHFRVHNFINTLKKTEPEDQASGVGLKNVEKRLNLLYPERHQLDIRKTTDEFEVNLKLDL